MQIPTREWIHKAVDGLPDQETEQLKDYLEFLMMCCPTHRMRGKTWPASRSDTKSASCATFTNRSRCEY